MPTYGRSPAATWRRLRQGVVLAVPGSGEALQLNATGALVWEILQEPTDASSLNSRLATSFARPETEVAAEVGKLLDELVSSGCVVRR